jgi:hypothetical protein
MARCPRCSTELLAGICLGCGWRSTATEADSTPIEVQTPEPPPVYRPKRRRPAVPLPLLLGAGGVVAIAVVALALSGGGPTNVRPDKAADKEEKAEPGDVKVYPPSAQDRKLITDYLAKNIADPDYEVLEWAKLAPDKTGAYHVFVRVRHGYTIEVINAVIRKGSLVTAARDWKVFPNSPEWRGQRAIVDGLREWLK